MAGRRAAEPVLGVLAGDGGGDAHGQLQLWILLYDPAFESSRQGLPENPGSTLRSSLGWSLEQRQEVPARALAIGLSGVSQFSSPITQQERGPAAIPLLISSCGRPFVSVWPSASDCYLGRYGRISRDQKLTIEHCMGFFTFLQALARATS